MSEQEEFEKWFKEKLNTHDVSVFFQGDKPIYKCGWEACAGQKDKVIEQQAAEIEALRGFAKEVLGKNTLGDLDKDKAKKYNLIDENGNPTKLLTGEIGKIR